MSTDFTKGQQEKIVEVLRKAAEDSDFRSLCLSNPAAAAKSVGLTAPEGKSFRFAETNELIVQLTEPMTYEDELSPEELEQVAGGIFGCRTTRVDCPGSVVITLTDV